VFIIYLAYPFRICGRLSLDLSAKELTRSRDGRTCCVFAGSVGSEGAAATESLTLVVVLGGEGLFRGGGRPLNRVACGRTLGVVAERPKAVDDVEGTA
jgi:hypothetical protein